MPLTEQEWAALERWRTRQGTLDSITRDAYTLSGAMDRLFPVRTCGDLVIRWDDEITPERLAMCGFGPHPFNNGVLVSPPDRPNGLTYRPPKTWSLPWCDHSIDELAPRNMGEVWQLMERCGIEECK
jgi:hypothetical protein